MMLLRSLMSGLRDECRTCHQAMDWKLVRHSLRGTRVARQHIVVQVQWLDWFQGGQAAEVCVVKGHMKIRVISAGVSELHLEIPWSIATRWDKLLARSRNTRQMRQLWLMLA